MLKTLLRIAIIALPTVAFADNPYEKPIAVFDPKEEATPPHVVDAMLKLAGVREGDLLCDLGSGDGRIVITAAKSHGVRAIGIEFNENTLELAKNNAKKIGVEDKVEFIFGDFYQFDASKCTVVTLFLWPEINSKLQPKLLNELPEGARIVSFEHPMKKNWKADVTVYCDYVEAQGSPCGKWLPRRTPLFLWIIRKKGIAPQNKRRSGMKARQTRRRTLARTPISERYLL
jgi:Mycolic acid cyclopropane synthetase